jgi:hypothetical protein
MSQSSTAQISSNCQTTSTVGEPLYSFPIEADTTSIFFANSYCFTGTPKKFNIFKQTPDTDSDIKNYSHSLKNSPWKRIQHSQLKFHSLLKSKIDDYKIDYVTGVQEKGRNSGKYYLLVNDKNNDSVTDLYGYKKSFLLCFKVLEDDSGVGTRIKYYSCVNLPIKCSRIDASEKHCVLGSYLGQIFCIDNDDLFPVSSKVPEGLVVDESLPKNASFEYTLSPGSVIPIKLQVGKSIKQLNVYDLNKHQLLFNEHRSFPACPVTTIKFITEKIVAVGFAIGECQFYSLSESTFNLVFTSSLMDESAWQQTGVKLIPKADSNPFENQNSDFASFSIKSCALAKPNDDPRAPDVGYIFMLSSQKLHMFSCQTLESKCIVRSMFTVSYNQFGLDDAGFNTFKLLNVTPFTNPEYTYLVPFFWRTEEAAYLSIFDINQYYHERMPNEFQPRPDFSSSYICHWKVESEIDSELEILALFPISNVVDAFSRQTSRRRLSTDIFYQPDSISFSARIHAFSHTDNRLATSLTLFTGKQKKTLQIVHKDFVKSLLAPRQTCQLLEKSGIISSSDNRQNIQTVLTTVFLSNYSCAKKSILRCLNDLEPTKANIDLKRAIIDWSWNCLKKIMSDRKYRLSFGVLELDKIKYIQQISDTHDTNKQISIKRVVRWCQIIQNIPTDEYPFEQLKKDDREKPIISMLIANLEKDIDYPLATYTKLFDLLLEVDIQFDKIFLVIGYALNHIADLASTKHFQNSIKSILAHIPVGLYELCNAYFLLDADRQDEAISVFMSKKTYDIKDKHVWELVFAMMKTDSSKYWFSRSMNYEIDWAHPIEENTAFLKELISNAFQFDNVKLALKYAGSYFRNYEISQTFWANFPIKSMDQFLRDIRHSIDFFKEFINQTNNAKAQSMYVSCLWWNRKNKTAVMTANRNWKISIRNAHTGMSEDEVELLRRDYQKAEEFLKKEPRPVDATRKQFGSSISKNNFSGISRNNTMMSTAKWYKEEQEKN